MSIPTSTFLVTKIEPFIKSGLKGFIKRSDSGYLYQYPTQSANAQRIRHIAIRDELELFEIQNF